MKPTKTWVLLADGARARILENDGPGRGLHEVEGYEYSSDHAATHDLVADRQGRSHSSHGPARSAIESRTDPHRQLKAHFAQHLAEVLAKGLEQKAFDRLVLVASPVTLGDLRHTISDHVKATVAGEIAQDLTKMPNADIGPHLKSVLVV